MRRVWTGIVLAVIIVSAGIPSEAQQKDPPGSVPAIDSAGVRKLGARERRRIIARFSPSEAELWRRLAPVLTPVEQDEYLGLEEEERSGWLERLFSGWGVTGDELERRWSEAGDLLGELSPDDDAVRLLLLLGVPNRRTRVECTEWTVPAEVWSWEGIDQAVVLHTTRDGNRAAFRWPEASETGYGSDDPRSVLLTPKGKRLGSLPVFDGAPGMPAAIEGCPGGNELRQALKDARDRDVAALFVRRARVARESDEAVADSPAETSSPVETSVRYPGKRGSQTAVEWTLRFPESSVEPLTDDGETRYELDVRGTVSTKGSRVDAFHYLYTRDPAKPLAIRFERYLVPDDYDYTIDIRDAGGHELTAKGVLDVPYIAPSEGAIPQWSDERNERVVLFEQEVREGESRIRLIPPDPGILVGPQRFDTVASGPAIASVEFQLDGRKVMTRRRPPYTLELNLGELPTMRKVRVVARDASGRVVAGDEIVVNAGMVPFRVHIVSPRISEGVSGEVRVEVEVDVPAGRDLDRVELYLDDEHIATGFEPRLIQQIDLGPAVRIGYLRAKAVLDDDRHTAAEDVVFLNAPGVIEQVDVRLVELPVTVTRSGHFVSDLGIDDFEVREEGRPVKIEKFDYVRDLPLSIGLAIDISGSMFPRMDDTLRAAAKFFDQVLEPGDKAFVVSFNDTARVVQPWTEQLAGLNAGLSTLEAEDMTALYDAIVTSLYNFQGLDGQRALIVLTDGADTASKFTMDQMTEFMQRSAVPIYVIAIGAESRDSKIRAVTQRIARESGGDAYYIRTVGDLSGIYDRIEQELRSQYVLGFYPSEEARAAKEFRRVSVNVDQGHARTVAGYYP